MQLLFLLAINFVAGQGQVSKREQMIFNIQTSKNALFKYAELEDLEMIKSKRKDTVLGDKLGDYNVSRMASRRHRLSSTSFTYFSLR